MSMQDITLNHLIHQRRS